MPLLASKKGLFRGLMFHSNQRPRPIHPGKRGQVMFLEICQCCSCSKIDPFLTKKLFIPAKATQGTTQGSGVLTQDRLTGNPNGWMLSWISSCHNSHLSRTHPKIATAPNFFHLPQLFLQFLPICSDCFSNAVNLHHQYWHMGEEKFSGFRRNVFQCQPSWLPTDEEVLDLTEIWKPETSNVEVFGKFHHRKRIEIGR